MRPAPAIREHEGEPVPGLPETLPAGERILWQGAPCWRALARRAFHVRGIAAYFAVLAAWRAATLLADGAGVLEACRGALLFLVVGAVPVALLAGVAWLSARTAVYTVTSRRLVLRIGIALPTTINVPFAAVSAASARVARDGTGDLVVALLPRHRVSWAALWPHARPWRIGRPEPMLRCIPDAERVGALLARALAADAEQPVQAPLRASLHAPGAQPVPAIPVRVAPHPASHPSAAAA